MEPGEFPRWASHLPEPLLLVQGDASIVACNPAASRALNLPSQDVQKSLFDLSPGFPDKVRESLRLWAGSGQFVYGLMVVEGADQRKFRCEGCLLQPAAGNDDLLLLVRIKTREEAAERFVALNQKIGELAEEIRARRESEERVSEQREWLRVTLSSIGDAVIATDLEGRVTFMNPVAQQLTGWSESEAHHRPVSEVFHIINERTRLETESPIERVAREGVVVNLANHTILISRDGSEHPIEDSAAPIRDSDGRLIGIVLVFHDVSERKRAEADLQASEQRFRLWIDLNVIGGAVADLEGNFLEANDAFLDLLGYSRQELEAGVVRLDWLTPPEYLSLDEQGMAEAKRCGACQPYEKDFIRKDGDRVPVITGYALYQSPQRYLRQRTDQLAMCFVLDISERKRAHDLLEKQVKERTARLEEALAELETFSYTVSHDLRAPLRSMQGYSQILLSEFSDRLAPEGKAFLSRIVRSATHLDQLIHDVLNYSRVSRIDVVSGPVDLERLIDDLIERHSNLHAPHALIDVARPLPPVIGNESLLSQCLSNLLGNAVKFVAPGTKPRVRIWSESRGATARLWIADNGIGIDSKYQDRIFRIFERVHGEATYEGTGIGLSIVWKSIERLGGQVGLESEPGQGSRFWIELKSAGP